MNKVTRILSAAGQGDPDAGAKLLPLVYDELHRLAMHRMASEQPGHTLQATALVHEAYLRLVDTEKVQCWNGRGHFFAAAAEAMRRILVERARHRQRLRHGGGRARIDLDQVEPAQLPTPDNAGDGSAEELLALDEALTRLTADEPEAAQLVKLRYFTGLTIEQAAAALNISVRTANRHWAYAKAWLYQQLTDGGTSGD